MNRPFAPFLIPAFVVVACSGTTSGTAAPQTVAAPASSQTMAASDAPTAAASADPVPVSSAGASPVADASPVAFASPLYTYTVTLPAGWAAGAALFPWDGKSAAGHEEPVVDKFGGSTSASAWAYAGPTSSNLATLTKDAIAANTRDHGDTCPPEPEVNDPVKVGGEAGVFLAWNCGILINEAVIVRDGIAYVFAMRDPDVHAATDPADRALFQQILDSVQFPG